MSVLRNQPKGARVASFGFALLMFAVLPREIGYQDIGSLIARQSGVTERWQREGFGVRTPIQAATFSFTRPLGTGLRETAITRLASLDSRGIDVTGSIARNPLQSARPLQASDFPIVNRSAKGDRLVIYPREPVVAPPAEVSDQSADAQLGVPDIAAPDTVPAGTATMSEEAQQLPVDAPLDPELADALKQQPLPSYQLGIVPDAPNAAAAEAVVEMPRLPAPVDDLSVQTSRLFFGDRSLGPRSDRLESWQKGDEPVIVTPRAADPDMKSTAVLPGDVPDTADEGGVSVAPKGEVTGINQRPKSPGERMGLTDTTRPKQEKCLAEAVYFEARGEAVRGQIAVAQVVVNRAFSGYYPSTVCGVVYQNSHRHLSCQFTFACDNVRDVIREQDMWERAKKIAKETLDGRIWLPEVGKSTHYHAYWVRPSWVHEMKKNYKVGVHTFYRPRKWGDGSDAPSWGTSQQTAEIAAELSAKKE